MASFNVLCVRNVFKLYCSNSQNAYSESLPLFLMFSMNLNEKLLEALWPEKLFSSVSVLQCEVSLLPSVASTLVLVIKTSVLTGFLLKCNQPATMQYIIVTLPS